MDNFLVWFQLYCFRHIEFNNGIDKEIQVHFLSDGSGYIDWACDTRGNSHILETFDSTDEFIEICKKG